jgi:hypothetical protein
MQDRVKRPFLALWARGLVWRLVLSAVGLCLSCVCLVFLLIGANAAAEYAVQNDAGTELMVGAVALGCLTAVGLSAIPIYPIWRRGRRLDAIFAPLGMRGKMYAITGREYNGLVEGREVQARVYRGPTLRMSLSGELSVRMAVGTRTGLGSALSPLVSANVLELDDPAFGHLVASSRQPDWARALLDDSAARGAILRLLRDEGPVEVRNLIVEPGVLRVVLSYIALAEITTANLQTWLDDMGTVMRVAEELPPPALQ